MSGFASAVLNDTLICCWPGGTSITNSEFGEPWLRPTLVPIVALNVPPDDGIIVRASTGTEALAPFAPVSWMAIPLSPGAFARGAPSLTVPNRAPEP